MPEKVEELRIMVRRNRAVPWTGGFLTQVSVTDDSVSVFLPLDIIENLRRYPSVTVRLRPLQVAERRIEPTLIGVRRR